MKSLCDNCKKVWTTLELIFPPKNFWQRVEPGDTVPSGECPECGALCYLCVLSAQEKKEYLETGYSKCPFCKSDHIEGGSVEIDGNGAMQECSCTSCSGTWMDVYKLVDIQEE